MPSRTSVRMASSDDRNAQEDQTAKENEGQQRDHPHRAARAPPKSLESQEQHSRPDDADRAADDGHTEQQLCKFRIQSTLQPHGLTTLLLHRPGAQLRDDSNEIAALFIGDLVGGAERFELLIIFICRHGEPFIGLR